MKRLSFGLICFGLALTGCADSSPNVILETELGNIEIEVYPKKSPASAADFLYYVDEGLYDGHGFYRTVTPESDNLGMNMSLIQGGRLELAPVTADIVHETTEQSGLSHIDGSVGIARGEPGTGSAAFFFINLGDNSFLDFGGSRNPDGQGYAVFGQVVTGLDVAANIQAGAISDSEDPVFAPGQRLANPVIIKRAYRK